MGVINEAEASPQLAQHSRLSPHRMTDTIMSVGSFSSFFLPSKMLNSTARATGISSMRMADGGSLRLTQFLRRITQCESRRIERSIIQAELQHVQKELNRDDSVICLRDGLLRVAYCQLLGYSVDTFAPHVAALVQRAETVPDKRVGYTLAALLLADGNEFALMLVNTMLKDLRSRDDNFVIFALTALAHLMNSDIATAMTPSVLNLLVHPSEAVRRRVIVVLECVERHSPELIVPHREKISALLDDPHASVVCATVNIVSKFIYNHRNSYKSLAPRLSSILRIIASDRLSDEYNYHNVPAPWFQMRLLRLIADLVYDDATLSEQVLPDILFALERAQAGIDAALGIVYECIRTLTRLALPATLYMNSAARPFDVPTRLLRSRNANLRCLGLCILAEIVRVEPGQAEDHQQVLVGCLDASDVNLRRLTLNLLYEITTSHNVAVVVDKMLESIQNCTSMRDAWWREKLAERIVELALRLSPNAAWFITTIIHVCRRLSRHNEKLSDNTIERIMRFIGQDISLDNYTTGETLKNTSANTLAEALNDLLLVEEQNINHISQNGFRHQPLIQLAVWVIGEYYMTNDSSKYKRIANNLVSVFDKANDEFLQCQILMAIGKIQSKIPEYELLPSIQHVLNASKMSKSIEVQNMAKQLSHIMDTPQNLPNVFPENVFFDYLEIDTLLGPIHAQAKQARSQSTLEFDPTLVIKAQQDMCGATVSGIRTEAYQSPQWPSDNAAKRASWRTHRAQNSLQSYWADTAGKLDSMTTTSDEQMWQSATLSPYRPQRHSKQQSVNKTHLWTRHGYAPVATTATTTATDSNNSDNNNISLKSPILSSELNRIKESSIPPSPPSHSMVLDTELLREQQELAAALFAKPH